MTYSVTRTTQFKRSVKKCRKRGLDMELLKTVIRILSQEGYPS